MTESELPVARWMKPSRFVMASRSTLAAAAAALPPTPARAQMLNGHAVYDETPSTPLAPRVVYQPEVLPEHSVSLHFTLKKPTVCTERAAYAESSHAGAQWQGTVLHPVAASASQRQCAGAVRPT